jgi:hypothetical protein
VVSREYFADESESDGTVAGTPHHPDTVGDGRRKRPRIWSGGHSATARASCYARKERPDQAASWQGATLPPALSD